MPTVTRAPGHTRANQLDRFMLLFKADEGIVVTRIEVWHGLGGLVHDVEWGGDHLTGITPENTPELHGPGDEIIALDYGLNFALRVYPGHGGDLTFVAYGADAYVPD
jgi:hypothetical protein